jgi:hypothetical protein
VMADSPQALPGDPTHVGIVVDDEDARSAD